MRRFTQTVAASLPAGMTLPDAFVTTMDWMEANGHVRDGRDAMLIPANERPSSELGFRPVRQGHIGAWLGGDQPATDRLGPIIPAAGDGSYAALWRRDDDSMSFVYLGSGSGSTMMCVLTDDPVDMLRLMAIGYAELTETTLNMTPEEEYAENVRPAGIELVAPFRQPAEFQAFVRQTFGVTIPRRASEIVKRVALMNDPVSDDPFWQWVVDRQQA